MAKKNPVPQPAAPATFDLSGVRNRIIERRMLLPSELLDHPGQAWDHPTEQAQGLAGILRELGITETLKAWYSERAGGKLVTWDGHLRKSLDPNLPWPVDITDLTDAEADYALATHDPIGALKQIDKGAYDALLASIESSEPEVQKFLADYAEELGLYREPRSPQEPLGSDPEMLNEYQRKWAVEPEQLFYAGPHRILCADATDAESYVKLMGERRADFLITSPPYNAGDTPTASKGHHGRSSKYASAGLDDHLSQPDFLDFLIRATDAFLPCATISLINMQFLADNKLALVEWLYHFRHHLADIGIWYKGWTQPAAAPNVLNSAFEFFFFLRPTDDPNRAIVSGNFHGTVPNVYEGSRNYDLAVGKMNAAAFPLHLPTWAISSLTRPGALVLDPFGGVGTTLLACQDTGRIGYMLDKEPKYIAASLEALSRAGLEVKRV